MKTRLSQPTIQLIQSLYAKRSLWDKLSQPDVQDGIIRKISDAGEPAAIVDLLPFLMTANRKSALICGEAIQHLLMQLKPTDFVHFDEYARQGYYAWGADLQSWHSMKEDGISYLAGMGQLSISLLGVQAATEMASFAKEQFKSLERQRQERSCLSSFFAQMIGCMRFESVPGNC